MKHPLRVKWKLPQDQFWKRFGVSQSAGSRIELGQREIPAPVEMLIRLADGRATVAQLKSGALAASLTKEQEAC